MEWANLKNGELLCAAEKEFALLITTDKNLCYQQNLSQLRIAVLVLPTTHWLDIRAHSLEILSAVESIKANEYRELSW